MTFGPITIASPTENPAGFALLLLIPVAAVFCWWAIFKYNPTPVTPRQERVFWYFFAIALVLGGTLKFGMHANESVTFIAVVAVFVVFRVLKSRFA